MTDLPRYDPVRDAGVGTTELHERPRLRSPPGDGPQAKHRIDSIEALDRIVLEAYMPRDFALTSARTRRLQTGVLVAILVILVAILAQEIRSPQWPGPTQEARKSQALATGSISRPVLQTVDNMDTPPPPEDRPPLIVVP